LLPASSGRPRRHATKRGTGHCTARRASGAALLGAGGVAATGGNFRSGAAGAGLVIDFVRVGVVQNLQDSASFPLLTLPLCGYIFVIY